MFNTEIDMVALMASKICSTSLGINKDENTYLDKMFEVGLGNGIADLVLTQSSNCSIERSSILGKFDIDLYLLFERNNCALDIFDLEERTKASRSTLKKSIDRLIIERFILDTDGKYSLFKKYEPMVSTSIAIEAKLKDWKRALKQAYRYNLFSNYSFVVLPKSHSNRAIMNKELFIQFNVGLATIDEHGGFDTFHIPDRRDPNSLTMSYLLNENLLHKWLQK